MKILKKYFLIICLLAIACNETLPIDKTTKIFSKYLEDEFGRTIPDSLHYYILVPQLACKGCAISILTELGDSIHLLQTKEITFITTNKQIIPESLYGIPTLMDEDKKLDNLNIPIANVTLIETLNKKVNFIKPFYSNDNTSIISLIKK